MADDGLITAYLGELRRSLVRLDDVDDVVAEAEDHLRETAERLVDGGRQLADAEAEAIATFGSAELVARVCIIESRRGAAVPTTRTRWSGLAAMAAPLLLVVGQLGNLTIDKGAGHGLAVFLLCLAFPAFAFGLWGLRERHGGLGRLGRGGFALVLLSPALSMFAGYAAAYLLAVLLAVAIVVFAVQLLRASVLPVLPVVILASGGIAALLVTAASIGVTIAGGDGGELPGGVVVLLVPVTLTCIGFAAIGWRMWMEQAHDHRTGFGGPLPTM